MRKGLSDLLFTKYIIHIYISEGNLVKTIDLLKSKSWKWAILMWGTIAFTSNRNERSYLYTFFLSFINIFSLMFLFSSRIPESLTEIQRYVLTYSNMLLLYHILTALVQHVMVLPSNRPYTPIVLLLSAGQMKIFFFLVEKQIKYIDEVY